MRRLPQLSLITLVALSLASAGLLWLNVRHSPGFPYVSDYLITSDSYDPVIKYYESVGWPRAFLIRNSSIQFIDAFGLANAPAPTIQFPIQHPQSYAAVHWGALALDMGLTLLILALCAITCEWCLRIRRSRFKKETPA